MRDSRSAGAASPQGGGPRSRCSRSTSWRSNPRAGQGSSAVKHSVSGCCAWRPGKTLSTSGAKSQGFDFDSGGATNLTVDDLEARGGRGLLMGRHRCAHRARGVLIWMELGRGRGRFSRPVFRTLRPRIRAQFTPKTAANRVASRLLNKGLVGGGPYVSRHDMRLRSCWAGRAVGGARRGVSSGYHSTRASYERVRTSSGAPTRMDSTTGPGTASATHTIGAGPPSNRDDDYRDADRGLSSPRWATARSIVARFRERLPRGLRARISAITAENSARFLPRTRVLRG